MLDHILHHVMGVCCGSCRNHHTTTTSTNTTINELTRDILNQSNIVYPVLGVGGATRLYGYHYIPLIKLAAGYYVSKAPTSEEVMTNLIVACLNLWPLLLVMLLLALIAGVPILYHLLQYRKIKLEKTSEFLKKNKNK